MMLQRLMMSLLAIVVAIAVVLGAVFVLYGREESWETLFGPPDLGPVEFATLQITSRPNQVLVCPVDVCKAATPDMMPPVYAVSVDKLRDAFHQIISQEAHTEQIAVDVAKQTERYIIRTNLMRFPDTVRVKFIALDNDTSTLAIYSQAQIGYSDRGVNKARVQRWLNALDALPKV
jgi:uncharacterized protein (DUF1499 family)